MNFKDSPALSVLHRLHIRYSRYMCTTVYVYQCIKDWVFGRITVNLLPTPSSLSTIILP
jgi:hypothetical protein